MSGSACGDTVTAASGAVSSDQLSEAQLRNAATIMAVGNQLRVPRQGIVVALAAAHQESRVPQLRQRRPGERSPARPGRHRQLPAAAARGGGQRPRVAGGLPAAVAVVGLDVRADEPGRLGLQVLRAPLAVPGWATMPVTQAAQAVQHSAYPDAYADDQALAESLLAGSGSADGSVSSAAWTGSSGDSLCDSPDVVDGPVVEPIAASVRSTDLRNYGSSGSHWARGHTGTDLSAPCGTPVRAATAGTVIVRTDQAWAGTWLVEVSTGQGRLTTWYAHMQALDVTAGDLVRAGQQIGEVGDRGNASGCHLHFEVHPNGGTIYQDGVDPSEWLQTHVGAGPAGGAERRDNTGQLGRPAQSRLVRAGQLQRPGQLAHLGWRGPLRLGVGGGAHRAVPSSCSTATPWTWSASRSSSVHSATRCCRQRGTGTPSTRHRVTPRTPSPGAATGGRS